MERYEQLLSKNEEQINSHAALISVYELGVIMVIMLLNSAGIFQLYSYATGLIWKEMAALSLSLPFIAVTLFRLRGKWIKYLIMTCSVTASGLCYLVFNRQAELLMLFPTVLVCLYYNDRLSYYTMALSVVAIIISQLIASYLLLPVVYRTSYGFRYILIDTAIPQVLFYICFAFVVRILTTRTLNLIRDVYRVTLENEILEMEKESAEMRGRMAEREKVSRDIHNSVGHTITAAIFALEAADVLRPSDPASADEKTQRAIQRMRESMETIRSSVRVLDKNNTLTVLDLVRTLTLCCRQMELDAEVYVDIDTEGLTQQIMDMPIPSERISFVYGAVQECITNGLKHGEAKHIKLSLNVFDGILVLDIWNDGKIPSKKPSDGFGLSKIRNYVQSHGGNVYIELKGGFTVTIELPMGGN